LGFHVGVGKRLLLTGGENAHLFPVVSELRSTIQTDDIGACLCSSFTAALSPFAGLGKTRPSMPASEQSVKDLHNLLPAVALDLRPVIPVSSATFGISWVRPWVIRPRSGPIPCYLIVVLSLRSFHPFFE